MKRSIAIFLLLTLAAAAQQVGQNTAPQGNATQKITVNTNLVVEQVSVKDKKGNPIPGLTAKDFTLTEDGVAQTIRFCDPIELTEIPSGEIPVSTEPENIKIYNKLGTTQITPETEG